MRGASSSTSRWLSALPMSRCAWATSCASDRAGRGACSRDCRTHPPRPSPGAGEVRRQDRLPRSPARRRNHLLLGARGDPLALWQSAHSRLVVDAAAPDHTCHLQPVAPLAGAERLRATRLSSPPTGEDSSAICSCTRCSSRRRHCAATGSTSWARAFGGSDRGAPQVGLGTRASRVPRRARVTASRSRLTSVGYSPASRSEDHSRAKIRQASVNEAPGTTAPHQ